MKIELIFICILVSCIAGCRARYICPKEHSYLAALRILQTTNKQEMRNKIKDCKDVDALRIVAFTTHTTAWPMTAGPNIDFDAEMEGVFYVAMGKLFDIGSDTANESIEYYKQAFPPDGAESLFFKECEAKRRVLQPKRSGKAKESESATITTQEHYPCGENANELDNTSKSTEDVLDAYPIGDEETYK